MASPAINLAKRSSSICESRISTVKSNQPLPGYPNRVSFRLTGLAHISPEGFALRHEQLQYRVHEHFDSTVGTYDRGGPLATCRASISDSPGAHRLVARSPISVVIVLLRSSASRSTCRSNEGKD